MPLAHIFNLSLNQGTFPEKLKNCRVIPVYKAGDQLDVDNYRPISLLSSAFVQFTISTPVWIPPQKVDRAKSTAYCQLHHKCPQ